MQYPLPDFDGVSMRVLTMGYARRPRDGRILLLERSADLAFLPGRIMGYGGKVEPGESPEEAFVREFFEETTLRATRVRLCGTYTYTTNNANNRAGIIYNYLVEAYEGDDENIPVGREGRPLWLMPEEIEPLANMGSDNKRTLLMSLASTDVFACLGAWHAHEARAAWADSTSYYASRCAKG